MNRQRIAFFIIASLFPSIFLLLLAEFGLRWRENAHINSRTGVIDLFWKASKRIHQKSEDATLIYELVPGSEATREGVPIKINSAGFRDDEFPEHVPHRGLRIVMIVDSVAWG